MNRAEKTEMVKSLQEKFNKASVAVFADYKGLSAPDADSFRKMVRQKDGSVKVIKNNLGRVASKDGALGPETQQLMDGLVGPTMVAFSFGDAAALAKAIYDFAKEHEAFQIKESLMGRKRISAQDVEALAKLPSREVLLSQLMGVFQGPARGFVSVLAAVPRALVTVLAAIEKKKQEGGGASESASAADGSEKQS